MKIRSKSITDFLFVEYNMTAGSNLVTTYICA